MSRHNQRITGKRFCKFSCCGVVVRERFPNLRTRVFAFVTINEAYMTSDGVCVCIIDGMDIRLFYKA